MKKFIIVFFMILMCGCIVVPKFGGQKETEDKSTDQTEYVMKANPKNVYRTSEDIIIKAKVQNDNGKWVDSEYNVLIPAGYYIGSGIE